MTLLVALAASVRSLLAWQHPTPVFFPDEFIYSSLARGIAETGQPVILGHQLPFPAVLTSYLTAPLWLFEDIELAYRLVQTLGVLSFSLAAIPVYLLTRRLSLSVRSGLLVTAGVLVLPDLVLGGLLMSEPYAFLLFTLTFLAAHRALSSVRNVRDQLLFLGLLTLLCLTRTQFVFVPAAYLFALISQGVLDRTLRQTLRNHLPVLAVFTLPIPVAFFVGTDRMLGMYGSITEYLSPPPGVFLHWLLANLLVLTLSCGWLLAPGALVGGVAVLRAQRDRSERTFALLCLPLFVLQLVQATIISAQVNDAQGRYLIYLLPLSLILFALAADRGLLIRRPYALGLVLLVPIALVAPIFELNRASINSAPILLSRHALEARIGIPDTYALIPFLLAGLSIIALYVWWKRSTSVAIWMIGTFMVAALIGGSLGERSLATENVTAGHQRSLSGEGIENALYLVGPSSQQKTTMGLVFWNREIARLAAIDPMSLGVLPVDPSRVARDGTLLIDERPYIGDLVMDSAALRVTTRSGGGTAVSPTISLFRRTAAPLQLKTLVTGLAGRGLTSQGSLRAWPAKSGGQLRGTVTLSLSIPRARRSSSAVHFRLPDQSTRRVTIAPGETRMISLPIESRGPWQSSFEARGAQFQSGNGFMVAALNNLRFDLTG